MAPPPLRHSTQQLEGSPNPLLGNDQFSAALVAVTVEANSMEQSKVPKPDRAGLSAVPRSETGRAVRVAHALSLCREALKILDEEALPVHIGARLDHVIADLDELTV